MMKRLLKYILQSVAGMIGISIYILADTFFISVHSGSNGLAVLNLVLPIYGVIYAFGSMIGIGSATRYGIQKSSGANADFYFLHSLLWSMAISLPFMILGIFAPGRVLEVMGADPALAALVHHCINLEVIVLDIRVSCASANRRCSGLHLG